MKIIETEDYFGSIRLLNPNLIQEFSKCNGCYFIKFQDYKIRLNEKDFIKALEDFKSIQS